MITDPLKVPKAGFSAADFDGTKADGRGGRFITGNEKRDASKIGPGAKGGRSGTLAGSSAQTSRAFVEGSRQLTSQFVNRQASNVATGGRGYQVTRTPQSLSAAVNRTLGNARQASSDLSRQFVNRQASNVATGGRGYKITKTPPSLSADVNRTLGNARQASHDLSAQNLRRQASNVATGGRGYKITKTPPSLRAAVAQSTANARKASRDLGIQSRAKLRSNLATGARGWKAKAPAKKIENSKPLETSNSGNLQHVAPKSEAPQNFDHDPLHDENARFWERENADRAAWEADMREADPDGYQPETTRLRNQGERDRYEREQAAELSKQHTALWTVPDHEQQAGDRASSMVRELLRQLQSSTARYGIAA